MLDDILTLFLVDGGVTFQEIMDKLEINDIDLSFCLAELVKENKLIFNLYVFRNGARYSYKSLDEVADKYADDITINDMLVVYKVR